MDRTVAILNNHEKHGRRLARILQFRMIPIYKSVEQNYSTGFPAKRAEGQALCATGPTGCIPPEGRPLYGRKTSTEVFRLED